ncbi:MAG: hypothetical protein KAR38_07185, partial [Calditrichia bacterium]|nr:hypothetical protein [Calditrichia bacterium]
MNSLAKRFLFWTPRIITIFFAILLSIFSLDVVVEGRGLGQVMLAILIHQIPVFLIVIALVVAWRREWVGTVLFIGLALFYLIFAWGRFPLVTYLAISGPLFLVGVLFQLNWVYKDIEVEKVEEKSDLKKLK